MVNIPDRYEILEQSGLSCSLGRIPLIAAINQSRGVLPRHPLRIYGSYAAVYITRGDGYYSDANGLSLPVTAGDMIFVFPELAHTYGPIRESQTWDEIYVIFNGPVFDTWRAIGLLNAQSPIRHAEPIENMRGRIELLARWEGVGTELGLMQQICALLSLLTEVLGGGDSHAAQTRGTEWITKACALLADHLERESNLPDLAAQLSMSPETFRKRFHTEIGLSPMRYRSEKRIEAACHLLQFTPMTLAEIARQLGFNDEFHLSKRFKQLRGLSPRAFRNQALK